MFSCFVLSSLGGGLENIHLHEVIESISILLGWHTAHSVFVLENGSTNMFQVLANSKFCQDVNNTHEVNVFTVNWDKSTVLWFKESFRWSFLLVKQQVRFVAELLFLLAFIYLRTSSNLNCLLNFFVILFFFNFVLNALDVKQIKVWALLNDLFAFTWAILQLCHSKQHTIIVNVHSLEESNISSQLLDDQVSLLNLYVDKSVILKPV